MSAIIDYQPNRDLFLEHLANLSEPCLSKLSSEANAVLYELFKE